MEVSNDSTGAEWRSGMEARELLNEESERLAIWPISLHRETKGEGTG